MKKPKPAYHPQWPCRVCGQGWKHCPCPQPGKAKDCKKKPINDMNDHAPFTPGFEQINGTGNGDVEWLCDAD